MQWREQHAGEVGECMLCVCVNEGIDVIETCIVEHTMCHQARTCPPDIKIQFSVRECTTVPDTLLPHESAVN
jgi:hypothetical protein